MYVYIESLNCTLVVDSPFQILVVDFSLNLRTSSTTRTPEMLSLLSKSRISLFNVHLALFVQDDTITDAESNR